jgi:hypothetical protein
VNRRTGPRLATVGDEGVGVGIYSVAMQPCGLHPRDLLQLSASSEFGKLKLDIWRVLEEEVNRAWSEMEK